MSESLYSLLADELDVSTEQAETLLTAMLREVQKRARREGVRLPDFGTFREQADRITFEPSESLARAVNHRFEGLRSEDLATAPKEESTEKKDEGPSTITLGYQDSDWSPLDASNETNSESEDESDTAEFEVPSADEAADPAELQASSVATGVGSPASATSIDHSEGSMSSGPTGEPTHSPTASSSNGGSDRDDGNPPSSSSTGDSDDYEHESLSEIWESEDRGEPSESEFSFEDDADYHPATADPGDDVDLSDWSSPAASEGTDRSEREALMEERRRRQMQAGTDDSGGSRTFTFVLVLLLLGGAVWYVLGQQGYVQPPEQTYHTLKTQVQPHLQSLPVLGSSLGPDSTTESEASSDDPSRSDDASSTEEGPGDEPAEINPNAGGWTIIVASRTDRGAAESLVATYRSRFEDPQVPIDVLPGEVNNTTRYRIGIGQFDTQAQARDFLAEFNAELPEGAWPLQL